jgi:hypothetical protein
MSVTESPLYQKVKSHEIIGLGDLFFFENYVVAEFNEGVNIDFKNFGEGKSLIKKYFGENNFGFIGNRINSYSIVLTDAHLFNKEFKNLRAYATVTYSAFAEKVFDVENHFFKFNKQNFTSLLEATGWVEKILENNIYSTK